MRTLGCPKSGPGGLGLDNITGRVKPVVLHLSMRKVSNPFCLLEVRNSILSKTRS